MVSRPLRRASCAAALAVLAAGALLGHPRGAAAQASTSPAPLAPSRAQQPPPAAPPPVGPVPAAEVPVPSDANLGPPAPAVTPLPAAAPPTAVGATYGATDLSAPVAAAPAPDQPFYQRWWFWTAVGAFAVTAVVIVLASSDSGPPQTNLGNMPAF